jgi:MFS family permease
VHPRSTRTPLVLASAAVLLAAADTYVVVLALPNIMTGVGLDTDELGRAAPIVSVFLLGYVAVLPLVGRLADLAGRVPVLIGCLFTFALGSLVTATAHTLGAAVIGRGLQGVGAGGLVPATLALVADAYPPERRGVPLGAVGAAQETGAVVGPLYGALVLAVASWRAIFWVNLVAGAALAVALVITGRGASRRRIPDPVGLGLIGIGIAALALLLLSPTSLVDDFTLGRAWTPLVGSSRVMTPLAVVVVITGVLAVGRAASVSARWAAVPPVRGAPALARGADLPGAALVAITLGAVVLAFASADQEHHVIASDAPALFVVAGASAVGFVIRETRARQPLIRPRSFAARPAWGGLVVSFFIGAALVAVLVDVPVFARVSGEHQLGAALLLLRLLAAVPVGALAGGWAVHRVGPAAVTAGGAALAGVALALMSTWSHGHVGDAAATTELAMAGLGFGLVIAPVNAAVLAMTDAAVHGLAGALVVVSRTVGMLIGLSALTALGLHRFRVATARIASPLELCHAHPTHCTAYSHAVRAAAISEVHAVFLGAAVCAGVAAALAPLLAQRRRSP